MSIPTGRWRERAMRARLREWERLNSMPLEDHEGQGRVAVGVECEGEFVGAGGEEAGEDRAEHRADDDRFGALLRIAQAVGFGLLIGREKGFE